MNGVGEQQPAQPAQHPRNLREAILWAPLNFPSGGEYLTIAAPRAKVYLSRQNLFTSAVLNANRPGGILEALVVPVNPMAQDTAYFRNNSHILNMAFPYDCRRETAKTALAVGERIRRTIVTAREGGHVSASSNNAA